jgi:hypothetical protein
LQLKRQLDDDVMGTGVGESGDAIYHSLLADERDFNTGVGGAYEGFHSKNTASESTHMSWDEVS